MAKAMAVIVSQSVRVRDEEAVERFGKAMAERRVQPPGIVLE
jgi:hypothetical protein